MSDLIRHYEELAVEEGEQVAAGLGRDPPLRRAAQGFEHTYFEDVFRNRLLRRSMDALEIDFHMKFARGELKRGLALCESPIEKRLLHWLIYGEWKCRHPSALAAPVLFPIGDDLQERQHFAVAPQRQFGRYRADFALFIRTNAGITTTIVECDGKDYHDPARDRVRDAWFRDQGIATFRATGSEIFRNPQDVFDRLDGTLPQYWGGRPVITR